MSYAPITSRPISGTFTHKDTGAYFDYMSYTPPDSSVWNCALMAEGINAEVYVGPIGETRYAKVLKTVAYVVIDEDAEGKPVLERWPLARHWAY